MSTDPPSHIPRAIWALGFTSLLMDISSEAILSLLPVFMVSTLGAPMIAVGVIEGTAEGAAAITKVLSGALSDWFGRRKPLAVLGYGIAALVKPLFALAPTLSWVLLARFLDRVGKGLRGAPRDAMIADIAPEQARGAAYGLRQALDLAGAFLGPLAAMGLVWLYAGNLRIVFWIAVLPALGSVALLVVAVREPRLRPRRPAKFPLQPSELVRLPSSDWMVTGIATQLTLARFSDAFLILKAHSVGLPLTLVPLTLVGINLISSATAYPAGRLSDQVSRIGLLAAAIPVLIAADLVFALVSGIPGLAVGIVLWGFHIGLTQGLLSTLVADAAPEPLRGTAFGMFNLLTGIALFVASVLAGGLWQAAGPRTAFLAAATLATLSLALLSLRLAINRLKRARR